MRSVAIALLVWIAFVIGLSVAGAAFGQQAGPPCAPLDAIRKVLGEHSEVAVWSGLDAARGAVLQLWQSPGGSWTLITIGPNGIGCMVAAGAASGVRNAL